MMQVINVDDVTVVNNDRIVLDKISFDVDMGSFVSIIGNNGSGKTSLIKTLSGFMRYSGYISINGYYLDDVGINDIRKVISVVLDSIDEGVLDVTVYDNLVMSLIHMGKSDKYIKKRLDEVCNLFDIDNIIFDKKMLLLDNELKQIVLLASAIMSEPSILLLDNCLAKLSDKNKKKIVKLLKKMCKDYNMTILMTTLDTDILFETDRVIFLDNGVIVADDSVKSLFKSRKKIEELSKNSVSLPFMVDLSMKLINKGAINDIYLDERKLVDALWK